MALSCIEIARNILGRAQNIVNCSKICVFFCSVSCLASSDGSHKTLQIAENNDCRAFSGAFFSVILKLEN